MSIHVHVVMTNANSESQTTLIFVLFVPELYGVVLSVASKRNIVVYL